MKTEPNKEEDNWEEKQYDNFRRAIAKPDTASKSKVANARICRISQSYPAICILYNNSCG